MSEDILLKYEQLVNELKSHLGDSKFDDIFKSKTVNLSKPEQFLIKMEMSRLSQPSARFIDLRGQVTGQVKPYEYQGKQHFMDDTAIAVFEEAIQRHGGYTLAVYEAATNTDNNHKVMQKKASESVNQNESPSQHANDCQVIRFASYESRAEERMNYSIPITVDLKQESKITGTTSDISLSGAKIKLLSHYNPSRGELIGLRLVGLEQDFELGLKNGIQYEVVAVEKTSTEFNYVRLKRTFVENSVQFDEFLQNFINGNKRRYKINLDNTLDAVISKGYEQYYIPRVTSLFTFFSLKDDKLYPSLVLTTENNLFIQRYFNDERQQSCLYSVLNQQRLATLLKSPAPVKEDYLYTFTHTSSGIVYYYSAMRSELAKESELKQLFLGFGSQKDSWQCFKIQLMPSHPNDSFIPLSLPNTAGKDIAKLNKPPSARVQSMLKNIKCMALITAVGTAAEQKQYQRLKFDKSLVNQLKKFGHAKHKNPPKVEVVDLEYVNLRNNKRYLYQTDVLITHSPEHVIKAQSCDFSIMGLQVECEQPVKVKQGDIVELSFPGLQKITKKHDLSHLKYEVMAVSKSFTTMNLKAIDKKTDHIGVQFFTQLIANNKDKLTVSEEPPKVPGISTALRNMVTKTVCQLPFYLQKEAKHFKTDAIGYGLYPNAIHRILQSFGLLNDKTNLTAFLSTEQITETITPLILDRSRQDPPLSFTLFVRFDPKKSTIEEAVKTQCTANENFTSHHLFLKKGIKSELVFVMRLFISRTGRPDIDYLANELKYVSQYALHKAKDLEEALWSVACVGDMIDVTEETLRHLDYQEEMIEQMYARKKAWLNRV